jgi:outer membrane protein assembly factor BamD
LELKKYFRIFQILLLLAVSLNMISCSSSDKGVTKTEDPEEAFRIAKKNYDKGDYLQAIDDFSFIKVKFSGTRIIDKSQYYLAMCYFQRKEYILSAYEFDFLIKNYPTSEYYPKSHYQLAMCYYHQSPDYNLDQTYTSYAINEFMSFIELYPKDPNVADAEKRIKELRDKLAYKDYMSGMLYFKMDNFKAALVYFDNVLDKYFDSQYADDALYMKIKTLIQRRRYDEAMKEIERFQKKFPTSDNLKNVLDIKKSLQW